MAEVSIIRDFEGAVEAMKHDKSCLKLVDRVKHIAIPPRYFNKIQNCVAIMLNKELEMYSRELAGVPVAFNKKKVRLLNQLGDIMPGQSSVHADFQTEFVIFSPKVGDELQGTVHKLNPKSFGCLVHGYFYVSVKYQPDSSYKRVTVELGDEVDLKVVKLDEDGQGYLSIYGECVNQKKSEKKTHIDFGDDDGCHDDTTVQMNTVTSSTSSNESFSKAEKKKKTSAQEAQEFEANESTHTNESSYLTCDTHINNSNCNGIAKTNVSNSTAAFDETTLAPDETTFAGGDTTTLDDTTASVKAKKSKKKKSKKDDGETSLERSEKKKSKAQRAMEKLQKKMRKLEEKEKRKKERRESRKLEKSLSENISSLAAADDSIMTSSSFTGVADMSKILAGGGDDDDGEITVKIEPCGDEAVVKSAKKLKKEERKAAKREEKRKRKLEKKLEASTLEGEPKEKKKRK